MEAQLLGITSQLSGRKVTRADLADALNVSAATIHRRFKDDGKPWEIEEFLQIADHLKISRATFLMELAILDPEDMMTALGATGTLMESATEEQLLLELLRRTVATPKGQRIAKGLM